MNCILASWNGKIAPLDEIRIPVTDRALFFGDAVYEALRIYGGKIWLLPDHMARLRRSLDELRIRHDTQLLEDRFFQLIRESQVTEGALYCQVSRGTYPRRHAFPPLEVSSNELIYLEPLDNRLEEFRNTGVRCLTYPDLRWRRRDIKTTNLLGNVLARQAAEEENCQEAILYEPNGTVTEGSHSNAFVVHNSYLYTHPRSTQVLPGVTSRFVIRLAKELNIPVNEAEYSLDFLKSADEIFLTGTITEVMGVTNLDQKPVGNGEVGPLTKQIHQRFREKVGEFLMPVPPSPVQLPDGTAQGTLEWVRGK